jgi:excisionase family DNA binding protein
MNDIATVPNGRPFLTVQETADLLHVSRWKVYDLMRSGELPSFKPGRHRLITAAGIDQFVSRQLEDEAA